MTPWLSFLMGQLRLDWGQIIVHSDFENQTKLPHFEPHVPAALKAC
jgi:hypothetical protein